MPYDNALVDRIRDLMTGTDGLVEKKMFGALAFTVNGHLANGAEKDGGLMIRCSKADWPGFCEEPGARSMKRGGKGMSGWVLIEADAVIDDDALAMWVLRGRDYAAGLPPK